MTPSFDRRWHEENQLGKGASLDDRVQWHLEHARLYGCRPIPDSILREIERKRAVEK